MYCCVALNDLTSVVEERCHGGQTCCLCQFFLEFGILEKLEKSQDYFFLPAFNFLIIRQCCKLPFNLVFHY